MLDVLAEDDRHKAIAEAELEAAFAADAAEASRRASMLESGVPLEGGPGGWSPHSLRNDGRAGFADGAGSGRNVSLAVAKQASLARGQLDSVNPARDSSYADAEEQYYRNRGGVSSSTTFRAATQPPLIIVPLEGAQGALSAAAGQSGAPSAGFHASNATDAPADSSAASGATKAGASSTSTRGMVLGSARRIGSSADIASSSSGTATATATMSSVSADGTIGSLDASGKATAVGSSRSGRRSDVSDAGKAASAAAAGQGHGHSSSTASASSSAAANVSPAGAHGFLPAIGAAVRDIFAGTEGRGRPRRTVAGRASAAAANRGDSAPSQADDDIAAQLGLVEGKGKAGGAGAVAASGLPPATTLAAPFGGKADGSSVAAPAGATAVGGGSNAALRPPRSRSLEFEAANMASRGRRSGAGLAAAAASIAASNTGAGSVAAARSGVASGGGASAGRPSVGTTFGSGTGAAASASASASGAMSPPMQNAAKQVANFVVRRMRARLARQRAAATGIAGGDDDDEDDDGSSPGGDATSGSSHSLHGHHRRHHDDRDDASMGMLSPSTAAGPGSQAAAGGRRAAASSVASTSATGSGAAGASGSGPLSAVTAVSNVSVTSVAGSAVSSAAASAAPAAGGSKAGAAGAGPAGAARRGNRSFFPVPNANPNAAAAIRLPRKAGDGIADGEGADAGVDADADADADAAASASDGDLVYDEVDDDDDDELGDDGSGSEGSDASGAGGRDGSGGAGAVNGLSLVPQGPLILRVPLDPNDFYGTPRARSFAGISDKPDVSRWQLMSCALFRQNTEVREQTPLPNGQPLIIRFVMRSPLPPPPTLPPGLSAADAASDALADPAFAAAAAAYEAALQQRAVAEAAEEEGGPYVDGYMMRRLPSVAAMGKLLRLEAQLCALSNAAPSLSLADVEPCFTSRGDAALAYRLLDQDGDGTLVRDEFASALVLMYSFWASTQSAVANFGGVSGAIALLVNIVRWIISIIIVLSIFDLSFSAAWAYVSCNSLLGWSFTSESGR